MIKRILERSDVLYVNIKPENHQWIRRQMKKLGYPAKRGKSEFLDNLFTSLRAKHGLRGASK